MAEKQTVAISITTDTSEAQTSVKSFKAQLREANGELVTLTEKFGATSAEAVAAAKKVAGLKDAIGDAKALAETFNPDKKFVALGGAIQGAVSGFSALQGAQALFGNESKDLEKTLLKVQSVMALQQGISGVFGAIDSFKLLANTVRTSVVSSFTTLRGALISTGLGALAVGIGLLIANFDKVKQVVLNLIPGLAAVGKFIGGIIDSITDFIGVTSDASRALAKMREEADKSLQLNNKYLAQHGDELDKYTKAKIEAKNRYLEAVKDETNSEKDRIEFAKKLNRELAAAEKERQDDAAKARAEAAKKQKQIDDKRKADLKAQQDALRNIINKTQIDIENDADKTQEQKLDRQRQRDIKELDAIKLSAKDKAEALALINKKYQILFDELDAENKKKKEKEETEAQENKFKKLGEAADRQNKIDLKRIDDNDAEKKAKDKAYLDHKIAMADAEFNIASGAVNLLKMIAGKNEALQKVAIIAEGAISVAKIITSTQAANAAVTAKYALIPGGLALAAAEKGLNRVSAAIGIATTVAATAKALSQIGGGGGGGISGGSLPAGGTSSAPILPQASATTINQGQINQIGNVAARAFVVESDVSGNQERIQRLNRAARIS